MVQIVRNMWFYGAIGFLCCLVLSISAQCLTKIDRRIPQTENIKEMYAAQQTVSLEMFKELNKQETPANIFFSPYSTYSALLITYFFSNGDTEAALSSALKIPLGQDKINALQAYHMDKYLRYLNSYKGYYEFTSKNRLYVTSESETKMCMRQIFLDEVNRVDFRNNHEHIREDINQWIAKATNNRIENVLSEDSINSDTKLLVINAAYFKGFWHVPFDPILTRKQDFYVSENQTIPATMMATEGRFNHTFFRQLDASVVQFPYIGNDISLFAILPELGIDVDHTISQLDQKTLNQIVDTSSYKESEIIVALPKFKMDVTYDLTPVLRKLGFESLFDPKSDLSLLSANMDMHLNNIHHKATFLVDEKGSEASSITEITRTRIGGAVFRFVRPFIYFIHTKTTGNILFAGVFRTPNEQ